jgi:hypothetical protein
MDDEDGLVREHRLRVLSGIVLPAVGINPAA